MKNSLIRKMFIILFITVLAVAAGVYSIVYALSYSSAMGDIRVRSNGVKDYITTHISVEDIIALADEGSEGSTARRYVLNVLNQIKGVGNIANIYIVIVDDHGALQTSISTLTQDGELYFPGETLARDLYRSLEEQTQITGRGIYQTDHGRVYSVFWPIMDTEYAIIGVLGIEFDVEGVYNSYRNMAFYSLAMSVALIALFSVVAYLSMSRATVPFYKRLAYTDLLTGYENRMSFEQHLREAGVQLDKGKSVTLMIFDVNNLKTVNDTLGHKHGDAYLKNIADILAEHIGTAGLLYRIGGDEFATILVGVMNTDIWKISSAIRAEDRQAMRNFQFSCASGVATFDRGVDTSLRDVLARADKAMYEDKKRQKERASKELR